MTTDQKETNSKSKSSLAVVNLVLFVIILIILLGVLALRTVHKVKWELGTSWSDDGLKIYSASDGPFVVTHLYTTSAEGPISTAFDPPIAIIDSAGRYFKKDEIEKMKWETYIGEPAKPPLYGEYIKVLYYIPHKTKLPSKW